MKTRIIKKCVMLLICLILIYFALNPALNSISTIEAATVNKSGITQQGEVLETSSTERYVTVASSDDMDMLISNGSYMINIAIKDKRSEKTMNKINNIDEANKFLAGYIKRFNKKFSVPPSNEKSDFMPLPKHIILDRLLTVKYTRTLDNGGCFSLNNVIFMVNNCKLNPKTKVTVLISKKIGVTVQYDEMTYSVTPIIDKDKKQVNSTESVQMIIAQFVFANCLKSERIA